MRDLASNALWPRLRRERKHQINFGRVSGLLLSVALLALFDGLLAEMLSGSNESRLLAGSSIVLSGPSALKNPVDSDLVARFNPPDSPLSFDMEGFFTGYWFGNGMWRGKITVPGDAPSGTYTLVVSFKGASAQSAQRYKLIVYETPEAAREDSRSLLRRALDINSFKLAAYAGAIGIAFGLVTWFFGRRYILGLLSLGLAQAYPAGNNAYFCFCPKKRAPTAGAASALYDEAGEFVGAARVGDWRKGKLEIRATGEISESASLLALLWPGRDARKN